jgi:beta-phosphoglucomutase family hydrolase
MLGLPDTVTACLFDLDGVLTDTATVHRAAWALVFDEFLDWLQPSESKRQPFSASDYRDFVDGRPREDGVRTFLSSRGIRLVEGQPSDRPDRHSVHGLANRKNQVVLRQLARGGVGVFPDAWRFLVAARTRGLRTAVVSSSANTWAVLSAAGLTDLIQVRVDAGTVREQGLRGKPAPDAFLEAARQLGVRPELAVVFEDALVGVQAGRDGGFGCVVGVDRADHATELIEHGADLVVSDLTDLLDEELR